jgi:phosphoribosylformimino-5-aminoimidazole carboxamide ribotide isomerase
LEIIPVIDIKGGKAVHAKQGFRERYQPLATPLCPDGDPLTLAGRLLLLYPFKTMYLADLDALMGTGSNLSLIRSLAARFPRVAFWVDQGRGHLQLADPTGLAWITVLGSESLDETGLASLSGRPDRMILSLDFSASGLLGPKVLLEDDRYWPDRVIIMNLASVGGEHGPDWGRFEFFRRKWPERKFIAAGGVRDEDDLDRLASLGFTGALIATALHCGAIATPTIERLMSE